MKNLNEINLILKSKLLCSLFSPNTLSKFSLNKIPDGIYSLLFHIFEGRQLKKDDMKITLTGKIATLVSKTATLSTHIYTLYLCKYLYIIISDVSVFWHATKHRTRNLIDILIKATPKICLLFIFFMLFSQVNAQNIITIDTNYAQPQTIKTIFVSIQNQDPFVSFQLDIPLDLNLSYEPNTAVLNPDRSNGHAISASIIGQNTLRLFAYSFSNNHFTGSNGWIAKFDLMCSDLPGNYPLDIQNGIIGNQNSQNILTDVINGNLMIVGPLSLSPSFVPEIPCNGNEVQLFANLSGGSPEATVNWTSEPPGFFSIEENPTVWPEYSTIYYVEVTDIFETAYGEIQVSPIASVLIQEQSPSLFVNQGDDTFLYVNAVGGGLIEYQWSGPDGIIPGETEDTLFLWNIQPGDSGIYTCEVNNPCSSIISDPINLTVVPLLIAFTINLEQGWNSLSLPVEPDDGDIEQLFRAILPAVEFISDGQHHFYPDLNINTIGSWDLKQGYFIKVNQNSGLTVSGYIPSEKIIELTAGWTLIPVISEFPVSVSEITKQLGGNLVAIKDLAGEKILWPELNISTLSALLPGKAYLIRVDESQTITF